MIEKRGEISREAITSRVSQVAKKVAALACAQIVIFGGSASALEHTDPATEIPPTTRVIKTDVIMQYPQGFRVDYTEDTLRNELRKADELLTFSTRGTVTLDDDVDVRVRGDVPQGDDAAEANIMIPCYTSEQIEGIHEAHRLEYNLGESAFTLLVLNGAKSCDDYGALADWDENISTYNSISSGVILHEFGHSPLAGNNKHAAALSCIEKNGSDGEGDPMLPIAFSAADIGEKIAAGCGPRLTEQGDTDIYSAPESVMGNKQGFFRQQVFLPPELARIAPEWFDIKTVGPQSGRHYLDTDAGSTIGVKLYLPETHPLKKIDPTIKNIVFGLQLNNFGGKNELVTGPDAKKAVVVVAEGEGQSYVLDTELFNKLEPPRICNPYYDDVDSKYDYIDKPIIYTDKTMDTVVSIGRDRENNDKPFVQLESFAATADKRERLKRELDKRRLMIFGDKAH